MWWAMYIFLVIVRGLAAYGFPVLAVIALYFGVWFDGFACSFAAWITWRDPTWWDLQRPDEWNWRNNGNY